MTDEPYTREPARPAPVLIAQCDHPRTQLAIVHVVDFYRLPHRLQLAQPNRERQLAQEQHP